MTTWLSLFKQVSPTTWKAIPVTTLTKRYHLSDTSGTVWALWSAIDAKITFGKNILGHNDKKRLRRDSLWVANNHSIAIIGVLSAPIALLFMVLVSLFLGHKIMACYIVLILFCLSLYIMSISKYDHCYFEYFKSIRDINIKKWRYQCLMFAIADMIVGAVLVCVLIHISIVR